jgi:sterol desaturase/sphingolipid hydroxylase (fatty acid hydroxylase superfamily)
MGTREHSVRLFESNLLERLTHVHPLTPILLWAPIIAWLLWRSLAAYRLEVATWVSLAVAGLLVWTLTEYLVHRWLFHLRPCSAAGRRLVFIVHGVHHEAPDDPTRLLMPPGPAVVTLAILYALFWSVLGQPWVQPFFAFFLMGYLAYDYIHFALHTCRPRTRVGRFLRRSHMIHHYVTPEARWGVSSPLWDHVFRTAPRQ